MQGWQSVDTTVFALSISRSINSTVALNLHFETALSATTTFSQSFTSSQVQFADLFPNSTLNITLSGKGALYYTGILDEILGPAQFWEYSSMNNRQHL